MRIANDLRLDLNLQDYSAAKIKFLDLCDNVGTERNRVGFFGEVGFPGISDIDALVVSTPEKIKKLNFLFQKELANSELFKYLFWHSPVFIIDSIKNKVTRLHTMEGLKCVDPSINLFNKNENLSISELDTLNVIWFISLIGVASDICRTIHNNEPVSLRLCLLVYKNLIHSFNKFSNLGEPLPKELLSPLELRNVIKEDYNNLPYNFIKNQFFSAFNLTCQKFDLFCQKQIKLKATTRTTSFISGKTKIYKNSNKSSIKIKKFYNILEVNSSAFQILLDYNNGESSNLAVDHYIKAAKFCKMEYQKFDIRYPFIQPFSFPLSNIKRSVFETLNSTRIVDFL